MLHDTIRPLPNYPWKYDSVASIIPQYFTDVPTETGECVILNHACIHGSYPNLSGKVRIAAILAMIPAEAEICHYFLPDGNPANKVEKYAMTLDDFIHLKGGQRPEKAELVETFQHDFAPADVDAFLTWVGHTDPHKKLPANYGYEFFRNKLSALFRIAG